MKFMLPK